MFSVAGVPAHPLLVHAVVVLLPLAALGAVAVAVRPVWARPYGLLVAAGALGGAVAAVAARIAGEQLEDAIEITPGFEPVIDQHERFGTLTVLTSWPFAVLAVAAYLLARRDRGRIVGVLAAVAGVVAVVATVLAGHSGAAAVWGDVVG
ncbi:DUF2231 domain-containing protein [Pseudonocardia abyssalis]|uniref:DUF2231 domain-containing protein n=1 Tax=Pseudonocardia abyssalis TaxID=2792008 RepID=A0ABS6UUF2_9PSEU|nr:DUF2231 domain-containing protein [Pseudonocardia abyssalis]MBW0117039.1 hypothetical protein [Pseudonocardia abyssalis]MBW0135895.1 hypothetical protein [Pseudonocardia abyssalis]